MFSTEYYKDICEKVDKDQFKNRVQNLSDYVEVFGGDEEEIELYLYDFIALALETGRISETNDEFYNVFGYLFKKADDNNIIIIKGTQLKCLCDSAKIISFSNELKNYLLVLYCLNEEKREVIYKLNYRYYKDEKEREVLMKTVSFLTQSITMIKNLILKRTQ